MGKSTTSAAEDRANTDELLTVIVPCLNEETSVSAVVDDILSVRPEIPMKVEILLIDDGSMDNTRQKMEILCKQHPECRMVANPRTLGVGRVILDAYETLDPDSWATATPGDGEVVFESIKNFIPLRHNYDLTLGYIQNPVIRSFGRRLASQVFMRVARSLYGFPYRYLNGPKLYRVSCFKNIEVVSTGHAFNAELLAKAMLRNPALRIGEVPYIDRGRAHGTSGAIRIGSFLQAIREVFVGYRSVCRYRDEVIRKGMIK